MPSTSPYTQNDYASVSQYRPYQLPVNDIMKAYSAQNMFWDMGAARVKSVYDDALGLKLSLQGNREVRDQFMKDAEKQMTKLSSMDLSDPSVQRKGMSMFKPLFQDEGIMYDDAMTKWYDKVRSDAMGFRNKDNGKGYSDVNLAYAMDGYQDFMNSKDRFAGKQFYQKRKEYTPYYDYTLDFDKALKNCHSSSVSGTSPVYNGGEMSGYMKTDSSKFLSADQALNCIQGGLSSQGLRQLEIEGAVNYRGNKGVLAADTADYLNTVSGNYNNQLGSLAASKHALEDKKNEKYKSLDDETRQSMIAQIDEQMKSISDEITKNKNVVDKLRSGDYSAIEENLDKYAGSVYSWRKLYKKAIASAWEEKNEEYKADPVQLTHIRFEQEKTLKSIDYSYDVSLEQMKENHDTTMKMLELMYGKTGTGTQKTGNSLIYQDPRTGQFVINPNLQRESPNLTDIPGSDENAYSNLNQSLGTLNKYKDENDTRLWNTLVEKGNDDRTFRDTMLKGFNMGTTDADWERFKAAKNRINLPDGTVGPIHQTSWFKAYSQQNPNDENFTKWASENSNVNIGINTIKRKLELGEKQVRDELYGVGKNENDYYKNLGSVNIYGKQITGQDIKDAMDGRPSPLKAQVVGYSDVDGDGNPTKPIYKFTMDGKFVYGGPETNFSNYNKDFMKLLLKTSDTKESIDKTIDKKRAEVYGRMGWNRDAWYSTFDNKDELALKLQNYFPGASDKPDKQVAITGVDFSGGIKVHIPTEKSQSETLKVLRETLGFGTNAEPIGNNTYIIKGTNYNVIPQAIQNPMLRDAAYQLSSVTESTAFKQAQVGQRVTDADIQVPVMIAGKQTMAEIRTYKDGDGVAQFKVFVQGANTSLPALTATNPYDLFNQLSTLGTTVKQRF